MKEIFALLNIEATRDIEQIKMAYRLKLSKVNPEDDQEGFKRLRSAYEKALDWAMREDEGTAISEVNEDSPEELWLTRVEEVYDSFTRRVSLQEWEVLLADDLCTALDTFHSVREKFIGFLMGHFRLPYEVWKLIDKYFNIVDDKKELYERFPKNFMDYVLGSIDHPWLIDYALFDGHDEEDYDGYIEKYHRLKAIVDENKESPESLLAEMRGQDIYHPYTDVEEARYYIQNEQLEHGFQQLMALFEKYPEDAYILYYVGRVKWDLEDYDGAFAAYQALAAENPKHFSALLGIGDYYLKTEEFGKAKDIFIDLLEMDNQNPQLREKVQLANNSLIQKYQKQIDGGEATGEDKMELGWCYLQNENYDAVLQLLAGMNEAERKLFHYNNLKGRTHLCLNQYQEALPAVLGWIEDIKMLEAGGDEENQKRKRRLGYAYFAASTCYMELVDSDQELIAKAEEYLELAVKVEHDINQKVMYRQTKANFLLKIKRYQESIDVCDGILEDYKDYYSAYVTRQECYFHLEYFQNVIDDYYRSIEIYPYYSKPYLFAARTFWLFRDYEAGLRVIERSRENKIVSDELVLYESRFVHGKAQTDEEIETALNVCSTLSGKAHQETDIEAFGDVYHQIAICLSDLRRRDEALTIIEKAIACDYTEGKYRFVKGNILAAMGQNEQALGIYRQLDKETPDNGIIISRIADMYRKMDKENEAIPYYEKALVVNPEHRSANFELMRIYKRRMKDNEEIELFEKVQSYASRQLELVPTAYYYIERGLVYLDMDYFKEALDDFLKASELEPDNMYALNNTGMVYRNQERYEEAITYFKKAIEFVEANNSLLPYGNMGKCYESLGNHEEALKCYQENLRLFPEEPSAYTDIGELLGNMGHFSEAIGYYQKAMEQPRSNKKFFMLHIGDIYRYQNDWKNAEKEYKKVMKEDPEYRYAYKRLAELYIYNLGKYKKAVKYLKLIMQKLPESYSSDYEQYAYELGVAYYLQDKHKEAQEWLTKALAIYENEFGLAQYISFPGRQIARIYKLGCIYFYLNDKAESQRYLAMTENYRKCNNCNTEACYERYIGRGMAFELNGELKSARDCYQKALVYDKYNQEAILRLRILEKKH